MKVKNLQYRAKSEMARLSAWDFLVFSSRKASDFLQADQNAYFTQHIKNLELFEVILAIKFLHGRALRNFEYGIFENSRFSAQAQNSL